jgi:hypothetical protein
VGGKCYLPGVEGFYQERSDTRNNSLVKATFY